MIKLLFITLSLLILITCSCFIVFIISFSTGDDQLGYASIGIGFVSMILLFINISILASVLEVEKEL